MWIPGRRQRREDELERELRAHLELEAEERGGDRQAARRALGNTTWIQRRRAICGDGPGFRLCGRTSATGSGWRGGRRSSRHSRWRPWRSGLERRAPYFRYTMRWCSGRCRCHKPTAWSRCPLRLAVTRPITFCRTRISQAAARHSADCSRTRDWAVSALRPTALRSWLRECMPPATTTERSVCSRRWDVCSPRTTTAREIRWRC